MKSAYLNVTYRLLQPEETIPVARLVTKVFDEFIAPFYSAEGVAEFYRYSDPESFDARNRADHLSLVAEYDQRIIGMLQLRGFGHISILFVRAECQRSGVGRELLNKAIELCHQHSPQTHVLTVKSSPNAVNAYLRLGFTTVGSELCECGIRSVPMKLPI
jgi:predicted GNAT family N-acyltransferase